MHADKLLLTEALAEQKNVLYGREATAIENRFTVDAMRRPTLAPIRASAPPETLQPSPPAWPAQPSPLTTGDLARAHPVDAVDLVAVHVRRPRAAIDPDIPARAAQQARE